MSTLTLVRSTTTATTHAPTGPRHTPADRPMAPAAGGAQPHLRLTRRGRLVVTLTFLAFVLLAFVLFGGQSVATRDAGVHEPTRTIEVQQGQTLWQIASDIAAPGEVREMVYRIQELNSLPGAGLVEGQELAVPAHP